MSDLPTGTITFLFTDIEGSTRLWQEHPQSMRAALAQHDRLLREAIDGHGGYIFSTGGDSFASAFTDPLDAVNAALTAQNALSEADWGNVAGIHVRMAIDTGLAELRDGDYFGPPLNRAARIEELARGANILLSNTTADLVRYNLPPGFSLEPFGEHKLRDVELKVRLFRLQASAADARSRAMLFGGLAASGAVLTIAVIIAVVLVVRSPSTGQPATTTAGETATEPTAAANTQVWSVPVEGPVSRPLILDGAVHVFSSADDNATLLAFDGLTGEERWRFEANGPLQGTLHTDGRAIYMVTRPQTPSPYRPRRGLDWLWVIDPADGTRVPGCGLVLQSSGTRLAVTPEAVFALDPGGGLYRIPTTADGSARCHDMADQAAVANAPPIAAGPVVAGSKVFISDTRSIYQLAASDLEVEVDYFPAKGEVEGYRGAAVAIDADAVRIQESSGIVETVPVYAADGEGLLHGSSDDLHAMSPADMTVAWGPLVGDSGVILVEPGGTLASYSHDLSTKQWALEVGVLRDVELGESVVYVTDDAGVVVLDLRSGEEIWRLETPSAIGSTGAGGWVYVQVEEGELEAYVFDEAMTLAALGAPIERRDTPDAISAVESFYAAFNEDNQAALASLLGVDARIDGVSLLQPEGQETLDWWQRFSSPLGYTIEISNCSVTQESQMAVLVSCDAIAYDPTDEVLGIPAEGTIDVWVADGLIRGFIAQRSNRISAGTVYGGGDFAWLLWIGFDYIQSDAYRETLDSVEGWAQDLYGPGYDSVCDIIFKAELGQWPDCAALRERIAAEYVADLLS